MFFCDTEKTLEDFYKSNNIKDLNVTSYSTRLIKLKTKNRSKSNIKDMSEKAIEDMIKKNDLRKMKFLLDNLENYSLLTFNKKTKEKGVGFFLKKPLRLIKVYEGDMLGKEDKTLDYDTFMNDYDYYIGREDALDKPVDFRKIYNYISRNRNINFIIDNYTKIVIEEVNETLNIKQDNYIYNNELKEIIDSVVPVKIWKYRVKEAVEKELKEKNISINYDRNISI